MNTSVLLEYGGYPNKLSKGIGCSLATAQAIFNRFHNDLYKGTTIYKEEYVLPTAKANGYIHLGLGARLSSSNVNDHLRSIVNATYQFWSILTVLAIKKVKQRVLAAGLSNDIFIYSTIHDSITAYIRNDPEIVSWYNINLIECMIEDFIENQEVPLQANLDIGFNYANVIELPNNCSTEHIISVLNELKSTKN